MKKNIISAIISYLSMLGFFHVTELNHNTSFINSILTIVLLVFFYKVIKKYFLIDIRKEKRRTVIAYLLAILFAFLSVVGYYLTNFDFSYLNQIGTYFAMLLLFPLYASLFTALLENMESCISQSQNWLIPKLDHFLFAPGKSKFFIYWGLILLAWFPVLLAFYPGIFSYDSSVQLNEVMKNTLSNNNPIFHTLIVGGLVNLGNTLFHSYSAGVLINTLFQMIFISFVFAYLVSYLNRRKAPFVIKIITLVLFMFLPTHSILAVATTKDVFFSGIVALLMTKLIDLVNDPPSILHSPLQMIETVVLIFLSFIFRHNGYYAFLVLTVFLLIGLRKYWKSLLILILCSIGTYKFYLVQVNRALKITPEAFPSAILCIPVQQVARLYTLEADNLSDEDKLLLEALVSENGYSHYESHKSDAVMWNFYPARINDHFSTYIKLYLKLGVQHPTIYIDAFLANTIGYWYLGDSLPDTGTYRTYIEIRTRDDFNNTNDEIHFDSKLPWLFDLYYNLGEKATFQKIPILATLMAVPTYVLLLVILTFIVVYKKEYKKLIPLSFLYGIMITLFLGPVAILRYAYALFIIMPLLFYFCLYPKYKK